MKKIIKYLGACLVACLSLFSISSCGKKYTTDEYLKIMTNNLSLETESITVFERSYFDGETMKTITLADNGSSIVEKKADGTITSEEYVIYYNDETKPQYVYSLKENGVLKENKNMDELSVKNYEEFKKLVKSELYEPFYILEEGEKIEYGKSKTILPEKESDIIIIGCDADKKISWNRSIAEVAYDYTVRLSKISGSINYRATELIVNEKPKDGKPTTHTYKFAAYEKNGLINGISNIKSGIDRPLEEAPLVPNISEPAPALA